MIDPSNGADGGTYRIGIATGDITPPVGVPLAGFGARGAHASIGAYLPLRVVAVALDDGVCSALIVCAEWLGFYERADATRDRIAELVGVPRKDVVLSGTHTHCGPAIRAVDRDRHGWIDERYVAAAIEQVAVTAERAWRERFQARLWYAAGECGIAMSRRRPDPVNPGLVLPTTTPNPDGPTDHAVPVLVAEDVVDGSIRAVLFSYACHPTARVGLEIGGDYVGFAYRYLDRALPTAETCFLQGCAGDQNVGALVGEGGADRLSLDRVEELGAELGRAVVATLAGTARRAVKGGLKVAQATATLRTESGRDLVPMEIQTLTLGGSIALVAMSAEMTIEHGIRLKQDLAGSYGAVVPIGYTNNIVGYVPVRRQFEELGYEVIGANQNLGRNGRFVESTEDLIHDTIHRLLLPDH